MNEADPLARLEKALRRRCRDEARRRAQEADYFRERVRLARRALEVAQPRIEAEVFQLAPLFERLTKSSRWKRLDRVGRRVRSRREVPLPSLMVELEHGRAHFPGERKVGHTGSWTGYQWELGAKLQLLSTHRYKYMGGYFGVFARTKAFEDLAQIELGATDFQFHGDPDAGQSVSVRMERTEARAVLALCIVRLLEVVAQGRLVELAAAELGRSV